MPARLPVMGAAQAVAEQYFLDAATMSPALRAETGKYDEIWWQNAGVLRATRWRNGGGFCKRECMAGMRQAALRQMTNAPQARRVILRGYYSDFAVLGISASRQSPMEISACRPPSPPR